jgi:hypothetical protein
MGRPSGRKVIVSVLLVQWIQPRQALEGKLAGLAGDDATAETSKNPQKRPEFTFIIKSLFVRNPKKTWFPRHHQAMGPVVL